MTMFIDVDTHVDECDETWSYMPRELAPSTLSFERDQIPSWLYSGDGPSSQTRFWFMDGQLHSHRVRSDERTGTTVATRELYDVAARVSDMDMLNVETQVIYPTVLLCQLSMRPDLDLALCRSYNRWLADRCADSDGRLRWAALPPLGSPSEIEGELTFAKDHGAVGVFKRGIDWDRSVSDPYFYPMYEAAQELGLPICIHSSLPWSALDPHFSRVRPPYSMGFLGVTVLQAFHALVMDRIPQKFPRLKFGFIEAGSSWIPYLIDTLGVKDPKELFAESRFYCTCEVNEDLSYLVAKIGDDNLFVGTDYCHGDRASVMHAHTLIGEQSDVSADSLAKITSVNGSTFYNLSN